MKKHITSDPDNPPLTDAQLRRMRPATLREIEEGRRAIENTLGTPRAVRRVGRPTKYPSAKLLGVYIRLHPRVLHWAKREAKKRHVGYQTFLSEWLLRGAQTT